MEKGLVASRHTQPYRATGRRQESPALAAMTRGRAAFMQSPGDIRRQALKKRNRRRKSRPRYSSPLAKILRTRRRVRARH
jgi:hypothetical protein